MFKKVNAELQDHHTAPEIVAHRAAQLNHASTPANDCIYPALAPLTYPQFYAIQVEDLYMAAFIRSVARTNPQFFESGINSRFL